MRSPKHLDKCEHAFFDPVRRTFVRDCPVQHLAGKPPGMLVARVKEGKTALVCTEHARHLMAPNIRKQKARKVDAAQESLI